VFFFERKKKETDFRKRKKEMDREEGQKEREKMRDCKAIRGSCKVRPAQTNKQASKQASKQTNKQTNKHEANERSNKQANAIVSPSLHALRQCTNGAGVARAASAANSAAPAVEKSSESKMKNRGRPFGRRANLGSST
jgi:hypothetical protein